MIKSLAYILGAASSGIIGAIYLWLTGDSVTTWLSIGYLFIASIWVASWYARRHSESTRSKRQWLAQIGISLFWWPAAVMGGLIGLLATQSFALPALVRSLLVYGFASVIAIGLGIVSLRVDGARLSTRFFCLLVGANVVVLVVTHVIFDRFLFQLSDHYEIWLILIAFVPLAAVNGWLYGAAFPAEAKPSDSIPGN